MPISHTHKLIFIHNPKAAGTSIMNYFDMGDRKHDIGESISKRYRKYWKDYKKFMIVRNPWDRFYSAYRYSKIEESYYHSVNNTDKPIHPDYHLVNDKSFSHFVTWFENNRHMLKHQGWDSQIRYHVPGIKIIKFENLNQELSEFLGKEVKLPLDNTSNSTSYQDAYNDHNKQLVHKYYKDDIEFFNYEF